jgi:hypothetical protein
MLSPISLVERDLARLIESVQMKRLPQGYLLDHGLISANDKRTHRAGRVDVRRACFPRKREALGANARYAWTWPTKEPQDQSPRPLIRRNIGLDDRVRVACLKTPRNPFRRPRQDCRSSYTREQAPTRSKISLSKTRTRRNLFPAAAAIAALDPLLEVIRPGQTGKSQSITPTGIVM